MSQTIDRLVAQIHASPAQAVLALSGGTLAASRLLTVPGATRTVLEAVVPYCESAMVEFLGGRPDQFCSSPAARSMAVVAFHRARRHAGRDEQVAGLSCTAALATDRPRRGTHRVHVALQTLQATAAWSLQLEKGARSRGQEEELAARLTLNALAEACGVAHRLGLDLRPSEQVETLQCEAPQPWQELLTGRRDGLCASGPSERPQAVLPGAFNPAHQGHRRMIEVGREMLGCPVAVEIAVENPDKPPLDYYEMDWRVKQFPADLPVWLTRTPRFEQKSALFPEATFLVGVDTMRRIVAPRYSAWLPVPGLRTQHGHRFHAALGPGSARVPASPLSRGAGRGVSRRHLLHGHSPRSPAIVLAGTERVGEVGAASEQGAGTSVSWPSAAIPGNAPFASAAQSWRSHRTGRHGDCPRLLILVLSPSRRHYRAKPAL